MDKKDLERRLEAAEKQNLGLLEEIKSLKAQLAKVQDESEIPDFPEFAIGDDYYPHIRWESIPRKCTVDSINKKYCRKPLTAEMNYFNFHSAEYYHSFESKCKLIAMLLHCKWYIDRDALDTSEKTWTWGACYDKTNKKFVPMAYCLCEPSAVTFRSEELAQKAADWLNAHWKEDGNG